MHAYFFSDTPGLRWDSTQASFRVQNSNFASAWDRITTDSVIRYIRTRYTNKERFVSGFVTPVRDLVYKCGTELPTNLITLIDLIVNSYDTAEPYTYAEAFKLESETFKSIVFGCIRVPEMIRELGHTRIATAGRAVRHKQFAPDGEFTGYRSYDVVFETHRVDGSTLGLRDDIHAVRCWCTTTSNEHWLWIQDEWRNDPLEAIAHTFQVHENLVPYIKELKRQGDVLLVELVQDVEPRGAMVTLSADQYFGLLTAQS
jgi:hypothetical protein